MSNAQIREKYGIVHHLSPTLEITSMIGCPLMCTFCPQKNLRDNYGKVDDKYMSIETLKTALSKIPRNTRVDFSGMSEPWANPNCTDMLEYTLKEGFTVAIYTTLWGMKLEEVDRVIDILERHSSQIEVVCIHLPDINGNMKGWSYTKEWETIFKKIITLELPCGVTAMTMDKVSRVHPSINHLAQLTGQSFLHTRADSLNVEQVKDQPIVPTPTHTAKLTCRSTPFYDRNVLLPNGDMVLCCMDYNLKHVIGNILKSSYEEIFKTSEVLLKLIEINEAEGHSKCSICKSCYNVAYI
jgi:sulfatase maturation enzyme AslB (radical SAM superfamily)